MPDEGVVSEDNAAMVVVSPPPQESAPEAPEVPEQPAVSPVQAPVVARPEVLDRPGVLVEVVGPKSVYDLAPGEIGRLDLTSDQRFALVSAGHIRMVAAASNES